MAVAANTNDAAEPWPLPEGWSWAALGDLGSWTGGGTPSKANAAFWTNGTVPWVSPKDMKVEIIGETEDKITAAAVEGSSAKYVSEGSVLMVMRSGILKHSFPVAVTDRMVTLNQDLRALTPYSGIDPRFIARFLALASHRVLHDCSKDGTTVHSIEVSALERLPVPLAPLDEQRRIVARVDELFAEIDEGEVALTEARKGLDIFRRALLKAAVTGELTKDWREANHVIETGHGLLTRIAKERAGTKVRPDRAARSIDPLSLPALPEGWAWATLADIAAIGTGGTPLRSEKAYWQNGTVAWFTSAATNQPFALSPSEHITERALIETNCRVYPVGTLLVAMYGEGKTRGKVTELAIPAACNQACAAIQVEDRTLRNWVKQWFASFYLQLRARAAGGVQPNLNLDIIKSLAIPIPPTSEAAEILCRLSDALSANADAVAMLDAEATDAARLKQSILKAAFGGRLVPQDPDEEPASTLLARLAPAPIAVPNKRPRIRKSAP